MQASPAVLGESPAQQRQQARHGAAGPGALLAAGLIWGVSAHHCSHNMGLLTITQKVHAWDALVGLQSHQQVSRTYIMRVTLSLLLPQWPALTQTPSAGSACLSLKQSQCLAYSSACTSARMTSVSSAR